MYSIYQKGMSKMELSATLNVIIAMYLFIALCDFIATGLTDKKINVILRIAMAFLWPMILIVAIIMIITTVAGRMADE